jgi:uncharacterized RDD family membrane protein YckC
MPFSETYIVETPEQTNLKFMVAGVGSRFLAILIDSLIQFGVLLIGGLLLAVLGRLGALARVPGAAAWLTASLIAVSFLLLYGYFILFEIFWNGQTPGKRLIGIRVVKDSGRRLSVFESIARNLLRIVDQVPGFYAVGILVALLNGGNKRVGDFVAGSLVIREASLKDLKGTWVSGAQPPSQTSHAPLGAAQLSESDLILIESFLARRAQLHPDVRSRMAAEIFNRVESKLTLGPGENAGFERVLEQAVYERRSAANG